MGDEPKNVAGTPHDPYATSDKPSPGGVSTSTYYPDEEAGTMIGPYKLLQQLGKGGMGVVWMAEQTEPVQRRVALKIIKAGLGGDQVLARFEAERQALAMMDHPNIAKVLDAGSTEERRKDEGGRMKNQENSDSSFIPHPSSFHPGRPYFVI